MNNQNWEIQMNQKITKVFISVLLTFTGISSACAQDLGNLGKLLGVVKDLQKTSSPVSGVAQNAPPIQPVRVQSSQRAEPAWLPAYPRSELSKEFMDPLQRTVLPLTMPAAGSKQTRYAVNMEGKVTMLQYKHQTDDSPLAIQRHYDSFLAQAGYGRVLVCTNPCPASGGAAHWMGMLDPNRSADYFNFPNAPTILVGHKENSMVFVAIGKSSNAPYASYIKIVEGSYLDKAELTSYLDSLKPLTAVEAASTPAISAQSTGRPVQGQGQMASGEVVETIASPRIQTVLNQTRGKVFLFLSSRDSGCPFCIRANPKFTELAGRYPDSGRYLAVYAEPWTAIANDTFFKAQKLQGIPAYLVFEDGKELSRVVGDHSVSDLAAKLF
jgi:thiol-disulfide isomerase/thioredoxin